MKKILMGILFSLAVLIIAGCPSSNLRGATDVLFDGKEFASGSYDWVGADDRSVSISFSSTGYTLIYRNDAGEEQRITNGDRYAPFNPVLRQGDDSYTAHVDAYQVMPEGDVLRFTDTFTMSSTTPYTLRVDMSEQGSGVFTFSADNS